MGGLTGAMHWWEESQLRVLVLTSLLIQFFLFFFALLRRQALPGWIRFIMWLAYHGGDAVAIYALATLFNRRKYQGDGGGGGRNTLLEVVWAPVLLIHLGGQDGVTAYNIEDNELSSRHLLTAVSQVTVVVYIFGKSWPSGGDKMLLASAILLFFVGFVKCLAKAWAFKRASINSLVSSGAKQKNDGNMDNTTTLEEYVEHARVIVDRRLHQPEDHHHRQVVEEEDPGELGTAVMTTSDARALPVIKKRALACLQGLFSSSKDEAAEGSSNHPRRSRLRREREARIKLRRQDKKRISEESGEASKLFVDLSSPYPCRIKIFEKFWGLSKERAYGSVQGGLASAFCLLYTKLKTSGPDNSYRNTEHESGSKGQFIRGCIHFIRILLPWAPIALFHHSHREAYNGIDVKVTYALLCCTAVLEYISIIILLLSTDGSHGWPETVAQYSLAGYFVRNKKHRIKMSIVSFFQCKDSIDQLWCMDPCFSSAWITSLVLRYLEDGWKQKIQDAASYRSFNNHSNWGLNMNRPFDECVLLWHLATDFCFFNARSTSSSFPDHKCDFAEPPTRETLTRRIYRVMMIQGKSTSVANNPSSTTSIPQCSEESAQCKAVQCRQMSNYMVYLLFVNPEMLLPGSRRNLFVTAYDELKGILNLKDWEWNPVCWSRCTPCGVELIKEEAIVMEKLIEVMKNPDKRASKEESSKEVIVKVTQDKSERSSQDGSSMKGSNKEENFIDQAWDLAKKLLKKDEMERWKEIQDVWVQMLCFSASRCRGYLHAKALGKGGEFLSYVWLLLFYMGMETFSERLQRELLPNCQGNFYNVTYPPPTSEVSTSAGTPPASEGQARAGASTTPSTSEICMAEDNMG